MWISRKIRFWKCEFCEKWDFENVNFVKNVIVKLWIFSKNEILKMWIFGWIADFCLSVNSIGVQTSPKQRLEIRVENPKFLKESLGEWVIIRL